MKTLLLILTAVLLSCGQPMEPTALPEQATPINETPIVPAQPKTPEPEPVSAPMAEPVPEPITPPYGSTVIGEQAYYVSNGSAMALNLRTGDIAVISAAAREYERLNEYEYVDNTDTGRYTTFGLGFY